MARIAGRVLGNELCKAWGLQGVKSLTIKLSVDGVVMVEAEQYMTGEQGRTLETIMRKYYLTSEEPEHG